MSKRSWWRVINTTALPVSCDRQVECNSCGSKRYLAKGDEVPSSCADCGADEAPELQVPANGSSEPVVPEKPKGSFGK
jgi:hypothetical protein